MTKKWLRPIDSAQRRVVLTSPDCSSHPGLVSLTFEIQGLWIETSGATPRLYNYLDMADLGVGLLGEPRLSLWDRLLRKPARVGCMRKEGGVVEAVFYCRPRLELRVEVSQDADAHQWRECEIMMLSAGFFLYQREG